jgi:hypothetical protein
VDSDYQLKPGFLRRCAPLFADSWVGFTQAPQDNRGWSWSRCYRRGLIFLVFLLAGAFNLATGGGELFRKLTAFLVAPKTC